MKRYSLIVPNFKNYSDENPYAVHTFNGKGQWESSGFYASKEEAIKAKKRIERLNNVKIKLKSSKVLKNNTD